MISALKSLETQINCKFEVLLVINPPSKNTVKYESTFSMEILSSPQGANHARNIGLRKAKSDLVMFLDSDCVIEDKHLLEKYVHHMKARPHLTGCGGPYSICLNASSASQAYQHIQMSWLYAGLIDSSFITQHLLGGNLIVRKSKLNKFEFDEKIIFGGTELEFLLRLTNYGHLFQLLENQSVTHETQLSVVSLCRKAFKQGQGQLYTKNKLNLQNQTPRSVYIQNLKNRPPYIYIHKCYYLFFNLGNKTWIPNKIKSIIKSVAHLYHRTYFYINLVKRVK